MQSDDVALWTAAEGRAHIAEEGGAAPAKLLVEPEARFLYGDNDARLDSVRMRFGPSWEWKSLRLPTQAYFASDRQEDASYAEELRGEVSPTPMFELGPVHVTDRNRLELGVRRGDFLPRYENRLRFRYQPKDLRVWPFVDDELRLDLRTGELDQNRLSTGLAFRLGDSQRLEVAGVVRSERKEGDWGSTFVVTFRLVVTSQPNRD